MFDLWLKSWRASLTLTAATLETAIAAQKSMSHLHAAVRSGEAGSSENQIRDIFHIAADYNMRRWEDTAGAVQGLPDWLQKAHIMPGEVLTDWFDAARRKR